MSFSSATAAVDLDPDKLPRHVAIIMDGNGRWAKKRVLNRIRGHEKGTETVRMAVRTCRKQNIPYLTLYAFSTENWQRPRQEVAALMALLKKFLLKEKAEMMAQDIRLSCIGQIENLPDDVRATIHDVCAATGNNRHMTLNLALSYGSRAEITRAVQQIAQQVRAGSLDPDRITENIISNCLYTQSMPDPDILIRTSGEMRISNFLLWQIAYAEIFVTKTLWPDFSEVEFLEILKAYQTRERRFGRVGGQV